VKRLETGGEQVASDLLRKLGGGMGEAARDLAYRLYSICDRKKWAQEAIPYNSLVVAWPEITRLARGKKPAAPGELFG
jgi:putative DNA methylase